MYSGRSKIIDLDATGSEWVQKLNMKRMIPPNSQRTASQN